MTEKETTVEKDESSERKAESAVKTNGRSERKRTTRTVIIKPQDEIEREAEQRRAQKAKKKARKRPGTGPRTKFDPGNEVGCATRFAKGNSASVKYRDEYAEDMLIYFLSPRANEVEYREVYYQSGHLKSREPIILPPKFPTFERFASMIGVSVSALRAWRDAYPRFADAYARAKEIQLAIAKENAITKQYDTGFTKFLLVNEHGMHDRVEQEQTTSIGYTLPPDADEEAN